MSLISGNSYDSIKQSVTQTKCLIEGKQQNLADFTSRLETLGQSILTTGKAIQQSSLNPKSEGLTSDQKKMYERLESQQKVLKNEQKEIQKVIQKLGHTITKEVSQSIQVKEKKIDDLRMKKGFANFFRGTEERFAKADQYGREVASMDIKLTDITTKLEQKITKLEQKAAKLQAAAQNRVNLSTQNRNLIKDIHTTRELYNKNKSSYDPEAQELLQSNLDRMKAIVPKLTTMQNQLSTQTFKMDSSDPKQNETAFIRDMQKKSEELQKEIETLKSFLPALPEQEKTPPSRKERMNQIQQTHFPMPQGPQTPKQQNETKPFNPLTPPKPLIVPKLNRDSTSTPSEAPKIPVKETEGTVKRAPALQPSLTGEINRIMNEDSINKLDTAFGTFKTRSQTNSDPQLKGFIAQELINLGKVKTLFQSQQNKIDQLRNLQNEGKLTKEIFSAEMSKLESEWRQTRIDLIIKLPPSLPKECKEAINQLDDMMQNRSMQFFDMRRAFEKNRII